MKHSPIRPTTGLLGRFRRWGCASMLMTMSFGVFADDYSYINVTSLGFSESTGLFDSGGIQASDGSLYLVSSPGPYSFTDPSTGELVTGTSQASIQGFALPTSSSQLFGGYYQFTDNTAPSPLVQGRDGSFYATSLTGGAYGFGRVFKVSAAELTSGGGSGTGTTLHSFTYAEGYGGIALIVGKDGNFYGVTGANGIGGSVFKLTPAGVFTRLYTFTGGNDGSNPAAALVQGSDGNFYGTTSAFGAHGGGTVFKLTPAGVLSTLHAFGDRAGAPPNANLNFGGDDGVQPQAALIQGTDGNFYGTTVSGGLYGGGIAANGQGTVFRISPTGVFKTLLFMEFGSQNGYDGGVAPYSALLQAADGNFYFTTALGCSIGPDGYSTYGGIYQMAPSGKIISDYCFSPYDSNGINPHSGLVQARDGYLYGTASGGNDGSGNTVTGAVYQVGVYTSVFGSNGPAGSPNVTPSFKTATSGNATSNTPAPNGEGPAGVYSFNAKFCNGSSTARAALYTQTQTLSNGNSLVNRSVGGSDAMRPGGTGSQLALPNTGQYADGTVTQSECVSVPYQIGLTSKASFKFTVNLYGH